MVITNLIGGLGNQMFQYAVGRAFSLKSGISLRLDISGFANYGLHQGFELQRIFNTTAEIANESDVHSILGWQSSPIIRRIVSRPSMVAFRRKGFVVEPHFQYWKGIRNVPPECYLLGYWQSENYFSEVATQIRSDFSFQLPLKQENAELANQIARTSAVSLHVRRGDYVTNLNAAATYKMCSIDYYNSSIRHVAARVHKPYFYIFSDDINWAKNNITIDFPCRYIDHNEGEESYNEMILMSLCQHHNIANSSYSWWGAILNPNVKKIVVAPRFWFSKEINTQDLIPGSWATL